MWPKDFEDWWRGTNAERSGASRGRPAGNLRGETDAERSGASRMRARMITRLALEGGGTWTHDRIEAEVDAEWDAVVKLFMGRKLSVHPPMYGEDAYKKWFDEETEPVLEIIRSRLP